MNIDSVFPSKYLKASDLAEGVTTPFTIEEVRIEEIGREKSKKPVIYFTGEDKGFCCNKTNANTIKKMFGTDTEDWSGKTIKLYSTEVQFGDEMVESIRVSLKPGNSAPAAARKATPAPEREEDPFNADDTEAEVLPF